MADCEGQQGQGEHHSEAIVGPGPDQVIPYQNPIDQSREPPHSDIETDSECEGGEISVSDIGTDSSEEDFHPYRGRRVQRRGESLEELFNRLNPGLRNAQPPILEDRLPGPPPYELVDPDRNLHPIAAGPVPQFNQQVPIFQPMQDHPGEQLRQDPRVENDPPPPPNDGVNVQLQRRVINALEDSRRFMELYQNVRMSRIIVEGIAADSARLISELKALREILDELPAMRQLLQRVGDRILEIEQFVMTARQNVTEPAPAQRQRSRSPEQRRGRHRSYDTLGRLESDIDFQLARMSDDVLENIRPEVTLSNEKIRTLYEVVMPQVKEAVSACQTTLRDYTASSNYDRALAAEAQQRCQTVLRWVSDLINRHRDQKLHLDKNRKNKEVNFDPFKPGQSVSIYEFLMKFERFSEDYLSEEAKADLLLDKYLDASITESYAELLTLKGDYRGIKGWLIAKFGSVVPMAHGYVKAIRSLTVPSDSDLPAVIKHLRSIHRLLASLSTLQIGPEQPVPRLAEYLGSNAFLTALFEAIPPSIRKGVSKDLVKQGLEDPYSLEGPGHLTNILNHVKARYRELEWEVSALPTQPAAKPSAPAAPKPKKVSNPAAATNSASNQRNPNGGQNNRNPPTHQNNGQGGQPAQQQGGGQPQNQPRGNNPYHQPVQGTDFVPEHRWRCPFRDHQDHDVQTCSDFFHAPPRERRARCRYNCCYTCLARDRRCRGGCFRIAEVPPDLVCKECAQSMSSGSAPSVLFCGLNHGKPPFPVLVRELEAWIPNLNIRSLGNAVAVNLTWISAHSAGTADANIPEANFSKTRPPTSRFSNLAFNTTTGEANIITNKDIVLTTSKETAYFTMQHIKIGRRTLLVFYDSGSNGHLIEGALAEDLRLDVITDEMVPIGGVGGKVTWSQYGMYQLTLGPDVHGQLHQLDVQGMSVITKTIPEADLEPLWQPTRNAIGPECHLPFSVGGIPVSLLIGIKSTALSPKLITLLPSGLGVYESAITDIAGSNICYGGPHEVFSEAYRKVGRMFNHVEIIFSEMAQAYLNAPRNFVTADPEDHGPMRSLARELDIVEECYRAFPQTKPDPISDSESGGVAMNEGGHLAELPSMIMSASSTTECPIHLPDTQSLACEHLKAKVPLQKLKGLQDELDIDEIVEYRCEKCARCPDCRMSARAKTKSLQEEFEQEVIQKSVQVDLESRKTYVDLPFVKDPVEFLTKLHQGPTNYRQALRVYHTQCRKPTDVKEQICAAHKDLLGRGYMIPLTDLPEEDQKLIAGAPFRHFYPWRAVYKVGSVSTPVRVVVDPSMTGLNIILAKGSNMLTKIPELLIKFRCSKLVWSSDVTKMYNQLVLNQSALPYSLFLFHDSLDLGVEPTVYVMTRAWYGVASTGNQAGVAVERLAILQKEQFPAAVDPLTKCRYVDDIVSGAGSSEELESQIEQTEECLKAGGFSLKFVVRSGEPPPEKASADGKTVVCLGIAWQTESDTISLAFDESFFLKKLKGQKQLLDLDLKDPDNLSKVLTGQLMTRAGVLSRVAELYDPCGWYEPIKVQMKLGLQSLNGLDWSAPVPEETYPVWSSLFEMMNKAKAVELPRSVLPVEYDTGQKLRLITVTDAGTRACGASVYVGAPLGDGSFSSSLILAKSRMAHSTVPRNELEGALLGAEVSLLAQQALGEACDQSSVFTDSQIVVCWVVNKNKRLRMWAYNRVAAIVNMIRRTEKGVEVIPLYHIPGLDNLADILTKPRTLKLEEIFPTSSWHTGLPWMRLPSDELPSNQVVDLKEDLVEQFNKEVFQEVELVQFQEEREWRSILLTDNQVDPPVAQSFVIGPEANMDLWLMEAFQFREAGWVRAWRRLKVFLTAVDRFRHLLHTRRNHQDPSCDLCNPGVSPVSDRVDLLIDQAASKEAEREITDRGMDRQFVSKDKVWYSYSRLEKEDAPDQTDLDCSPFIDSPNIKRLLPIVLTSSAIFHSFLAFIHLVDLPHRGVEVTFKRLRERFHPIGNARQLITKFKAACAKCRIMLKRTIALELADFPLSRSTIAPPFYAIQVDIAMGFKAKVSTKSTKTIDCSALVVVCQLTSATNILAMEGISTQVVIQALERHSSRYGMPAKLFVDSGTQLAKLEDTQFRLRDLSAAVTGLQQLEVIVATPKAHHQVGKVEAKIKVLRQMLDSWSRSSTECNTILGWETVFSKIASAVDDLPMARGDSSSASDMSWEIITPNRLKLGRNNHRQLEGRVILNNCPQTQLERNQVLTARWYEIFIQRIHLLIPPPRVEHDRLPRNGDIVLFVHQDPNFKKLWVWRLGKIVEQVSRSTFRIQYSLGEGGGGGEPRFVERAVTQISLIVPVDQVSLHHPDFFNN